MHDKTKKDLAKKLNEDGYNFSEIGSTLGLTRHAARSLCNYKNKVQPKKRGPKQKITKSTILSIKRQISNFEKNSEKINSTKIQRTCNLNVSRRTVRRCIGRMGFKYKRISPQIVLSKKHKIERLDVISQWISDNHNWESTIFSDEKRFSMDGPDDWRSFVRKPGKLIRNRRPCEGGGIMVWLMVQPNGLLAHKIINGKFCAIDYINLLSSMIVPIMKLNFGENFYYQHDNAPVHKARVVTDYMNTNQIKVIPWPAKSPDLNIAEDIWKVMSDFIYDGKQYYNRADLINAINNCVYDINNNRRSIVFNLYATIRRRLCTVLKCNGNLFNK